MESIFSFFAVQFDLPILDWIAQNLKNPLLDTLMPLITMLGDAGIFWIAVAVALLIFPKTRKIGLSMGAALLIGLLICNVTLKPLMARMRPYDYQMLYYGKVIPLLIEAPHDYSFPSGHTLASFEAAVALTVYNRKWGIPALVLAAVIAFSRLYLYVHYPTDVLFSMLISVAIAFLACFLVKKGYALYEAKKAVK